MKLFSWKIKIYRGACLYIDLGGKRFKMNDFFKVSVQLEIVSATSGHDAGMLFPKQVHLMCNIYGWTY